MRNLSTRLGITPTATLALLVISALLVANLAGIAYRERPQRQPESKEQFARAAADCFERGGSEFSVRDGCR